MSIVSLEKLSGGGHLLDKSATIERGHKSDEMVQ
jgi:hypothetical protein